MVVVRNNIIHPAQICSYFIFSSEELASCCQVKLSEVLKQHFNEWLSNGAKNVLVNIRDCKDKVSLRINLVDSTRPTNVFSSITSCLNSDHSIVSFNIVMELFRIFWFQNFGDNPNYSPSSREFDAWLKNHLSKYLMVISMMPYNANAFCGDFVMKGLREIMPSKFARGQWPRNVFLSM